MAKQDLTSLQSHAAQVLALPEPAQGLIKHYSNLQIMGASCPTPYHINCGLFSRNRALVGKGRPDEIEKAAEHFFKRFNTAIKPRDSIRLKASLRDYGIGVDCSGFAAWVLNELTIERLGKSLWKCLKFPSARSRVVSKMRPIENISAALLTGDRNTKRVEDLRTVRPGDLIRALSGGHVIVITEVGIDSADHALYFQYSHSAAGHEENGGVSQGFVILHSPKQKLTAQAWTEGDTATPPAFLAVKAGGDDSRVVRLRLLA
jgi:hypothetical protein